MSAFPHKLWSAAPLALALLALALRLLTPRAEPAAHPAQDPRVYTPPLAFLAAARGPGVDERWTVDVSTSRAQLRSDASAEPVEYRVEGVLNLAADDAFAGADLVLTPLDLQSARPRSLRVHIAASATRTSPVPGLHAARPAVRLVSEVGSLPAQLELTWMRLPGRQLALDAVSEPALALERLARPARALSPWEREPRALLSLRLRLEGAHESR